MKVTIVVGGRWHAFDLAKQLEEAGHLHRLITNYPYWFVKRWGIPKRKVVSLPMTFWIVKAIYRLGGESLMMRCQWIVHQWFANQAVRYLDGSEIIHGWSQWSEPSLQWAKKKGLPTVLERSSAHILEQSKLLRREHKRLGLKWVETHPKIEAMELREYELCTSIAIPSLFVKRSFECQKFPSQKLFRNPLGVSLKHFYPPEESFGLQAPTRNNFQIIYAGSLSVRKGIPDLLSGFAEANLQSARLILIGGSTRELQPMLKKQPQQVEQIGHRPQDELRNYYGLSHCFVMASIEEGMAMVQLQAMACGLPLICTTNTGGEDLLRLGGYKGETNVMSIQQFAAGFLIPIHNPQAIAHCLNRFANEPELWRSMRRAALETAKQKLDWRDYGQRTIQHYATLIK
jgi:starch synthase